MPRTHWPRCCRSTGTLYERYTTAHAAIDAASSFDADLILLDIGLPSMDGYEVASRLRAAGINSTLVALTGYGQKEDIERALNAGFNAHLAKPVEFARLEELLLGIASRTA